MRILTMNSAAAAITCLIGALLQVKGANVEITENEPARHEEHRSECDNFYKHVCTRSEKKASPSALKKELNHKVRGILESYSDIDDSSAVESDRRENSANVARMAHKVYRACVDDQHKESRQDVKSAMSKMLESIGIRNWPLTATSETPTETYVEILEKTGLRPLATIAPVPDRQHPWYILAVNGPWPRYGAYPDTMKKIKNERKRYRAYKKFMRSVLSLILDAEKGSDIPPKPSQVTSRGYEDEQVEDEYEYQEDTDPTSTEEHDEAADVISEIIDVEVKIAEMMSTARILDDYETDTVQNWDHRLGNKFPFMTGLRRDFEKAMITLANNHIVGVHLKDYFKKLAQYLDTLEVKTLINYLGWYFLREVADVLTTEVRTTLNAFLRAISKPGVAQQLNEDVCIEKLIGYHAKMEKGIAHLYLKRFFSQAAISKASTVAVHLNASFTKFIQENSWMDEETRGKMSEWVTNIEYHMGAAETLLDEKYIRKQYDLVTFLEENSLPLYFFALMENNYLQEIRRYMTPYNRRNVWPSSVLRTEGRYSPHYTSLEMPAGALQDAIFKYYAPGYSIFGSMGTLTAEKLADSFMEEGRGWMFWKGSYVWTEKAKRQLKQRLQCLRNEEYKNLSSEDRKKLDALDRFDGKGGESVLFLKFRDHVGLRTSYQAFASIVSECSSSYTLYKEKNEEMFKQFFYYYVLRNCGSDDPEQEHRVNFALRTFTNFWSAFHCKDGDRMRREDNCHIMTSPADNTITSGQK